MVKEVSSVAQFDSELNGAGSKLVVVDFHAVWCGPCKVIAPTFQSLSSQNPNVVFLKVDVDKVQQVAQRYSVRAMPTFLFLKNKSVVDTLQGADPRRLTALVAQHSTTSSSSAFSGSGNTLSGTSVKPRSAPAQAAAGITEGHSSLLSLIEPKESSATNEHPEHRLHDILQGPADGKWLESDADEQLLIHLSFKQRVKVSGVLLRVADAQAASAPKQLKMFVNRIGLTFDDADEESGDQAVELDAEYVSGAGKVYALRFVKFQSVDSLTIAVLSNQSDGEITRVDALDIFGLSGDATNISNLQKIAAEAEATDLEHHPVSRTGLKGGSSTPRSNSIPNLAAYTVDKPTSRHSRSQSSPNIGPSAPKPRRQPSVTDAAIVEEEEEEEEDLERESYATRRTSSLPRSSPYLSRDDDIAFELAQKAEAEGFGGWHYAPLVVAMAPPVGALLGGHSDAWSDAILLLLASFWLYQFLRVPWEIYHAARTRRVLSHDEDVETDATDGTPRETTESDESKRLMREAAAAELRRSEFMSLLFCVASPIMGAYMLYWMRETMVDGGRYLNAFNIRLFTLAAGVKPWSHAIKLIQRRMLHLQEEVHYPSSKVEGLNQRLHRLEADLSSLRKMYATKNDLRVLRDSEAQLNRAVRRSERKEEHLRLTAEEKFQMVESRLEDLLREVAINAELIEQERRERESSTSLRLSLVGAARYALGTATRPAAPKQYLHDVNRAVTNLAAPGLGVPALAGGAQPAYSTPGRVGNQTSASSSSSASPTTPAALDSYLINNYYNGQKGGTRSTQYHQVSYPWYERGMAFYLFLPLNASSAAIRFAGEKVKGILEAPETEAALIKQARHLQYQEPHSAISRSGKSVKRVVDPSTGRTR